jgi:hypothetical protein
MKWNIIGICTVQLSHFHNLSVISSFIHFFKMCSSIVECFCSLCYIKCEGRFHDDNIQDDMEYLTYEFTWSKDMYNGFADREMGCTDHNDYFSICVNDDKHIVKKLSKTYLDVVTGIELSKGYIVILSSCLLVSTFLSLLHYQSFLGTSQFTLSAIFHPQPFFYCQLLYIVSHFASQSLYSVNHFIHSVILPRKPFYTLSHFTT